MKVAMLGTRECPYQHQQEIELLSEARVMRGDHIFTSGSSGTNASVIKGALKARRPELLTVVLPQSMKKQDKDSQSLLRARVRGVPRPGRGGEGDRAHGYDVLSGLSSAPHPQHKNPAYRHRHSSSPCQDHFSRFDGGGSA